MKEMCGEATWTSNDSRANYLCMLNTLTITTLDFSILEFASAAGIVSEKELYNC